MIDDKNEKIKNTVNSINEVIEEMQLLLEKILKLIK